jgi:hypothetical protein
MRHVLYLSLVLLTLFACQDVGLDMAFPSSTVTGAGAAFDVDDWHTPIILSLLAVSTVRIRCVWIAKSGLL